MIRSSRLPLAGRGIRRNVKRRGMGRGLRANRGGSRELGEHSRLSEKPHYFILFVRESRSTSRGNNRLREQGA